MRIGMVVLMAGIGAIISACDNDKLDSEGGLRLFSGKEKAAQKGREEVVDVVEECCGVENPCNWDNDGTCDCGGAVSWDWEDCQEREDTSSPPEDTYSPPIECDSDVDCPAGMVCPACPCLSCECVPCPEGEECPPCECPPCECGQAFCVPLVVCDPACEAPYTCVDGACVPKDTWTDPNSGLTWQVTPTGGDYEMEWSDAKAHCTGLSLNGGGWRLPTIGEFRTLIRGCPATEDGGSCNVQEGVCLASSCQDGSCNGCSGDEGPADGCYWPDEMEGQCTWYWSSSAVEDDDGVAWGVDFTYGEVPTVFIDYGFSPARCVR